MKQVLPDKEYSLKRLIKSFKYAKQGMKYAYRNEQNLTIHTIAALLVIIFGILLHINKLEWMLVVIVIGLVIASEMINTALEAVVDIASPDFNDLAKIAKDCASGAVLIIALTAIILGIIVFLPKIITLIGGIL